MSEMRLYDANGKRLYLTPQERDLFAQVALTTENAEVRTFCRFLYYTGCRLSEALEITSDRIDIKNGAVMIRSLKKRGGRVLYRAIPIPTMFLDELNLVHRIKASSKKPFLLWPWSRTTGWRRVLEVMSQAKISGDHATPKGIRHAFGIACVVKAIPLVTIQKWLGHADIKTTSIYTTAIGEEERQIAERLWR